jgi:carbonic anhydrase/acetyltransferase-like protein (isoleucine patch superfamily)
MPNRSRRCQPGCEALEARWVLSAVNPILQTTLSSAGADFTPIPSHRPVLPPGADPSQASFIDPSVQIQGAGNVRVARQVYVGPFASLAAQHHRITIGQGTNLQDNVSVDARRGDVTIAANVAVAHGATINGGARVGSPNGLPTFVGFNAVVDGATIEGGAMVLGLARVAPGITIPSGFKVLAGKFVQTQAQAGNPSLGKVAPVTPEDRDFINGVLSFNKKLASGYSILNGQSPTFVRGIAPNPFVLEKNISPTIPVLAGRPTLDPSFRDRVIGLVRLQDSLGTLKGLIGHQDSLRADEGFPLIFGPNNQISDRVTFHPAAGTIIGRNDHFAFHSVIHGGHDDPHVLSAASVIGDNVAVGDSAVIYDSSIGSGAVIGAKAYIESSTVAPGTVIAPGTILINNQFKGMVEW